jgi:hypothetical protein
MTDMFNIITKIIVESWLVLEQMAPYLIFGFLMAGLLSVLISPQWVERNLGGNGIGKVIKASILGVPLPLCSCGVIPVSASIRRHGASRASTTAFLLSTPQTGVDSITITYALLGPFFAIFRPIAALVTGIFGGWLVQVFDKNGDQNQVATPENHVCTEECCNGNPQQGKLRRALHYGMVTLPRDIGLTLLVGIVIAGMMTVLIPAGFLENYIGYGAISILLMMLVGIPIYVCATASVPIAAGFLHLGATPGAALAFLIAGPATNAAAITTIWKVLGRRTAIIYLATVAISAFGLGLLLDWLFPTFGGTLPALGSGMHQHQGSLWFSHTSSIALLAIIGYSYLTGRLKHSTLNSGDTCTMEDSNNMENLKLKVSGMTCSHCSASVQRILTEQKGVHSAVVDLKTGSALVTGHDLNKENIVKAVEGLGYTARIE